jgi:hypothetical protein
MLFADVHLSSSNNVKGSSIIVAVTFVVSRSGASAKHVHYVLIYAQIVGCEKTKIWGDRGSKDVQFFVRGRGSADQRENERVVCR